MVKIYLPYRRWRKIMNENKALSNVSRQINQMINEIATGEHRVRMHVSILADAIRVEEYLSKKIQKPGKDK